MRWVLLAAALVAAGYFGWQRFHGTDQAAQADSAQKAAAARSAASSGDGRRGREGGFSGVC